VREDRLLEGILGFFDERLFGPHRRDLLESDDDPEGILFRRVRERLSELEQDRTQKLDELRALDAEHLDIGPGAIELLDELPVGEGLFASAPDDVLRQLFQTFRLEA
jgi:hypothetical protein